MGDRPLRLLIIAPYPLFPLHAGGKIRIVKLARELATLGVEVTLAAPFAFGGQPPTAERFALDSVKYPFVLPALLTDRPFPYGALVSFHPGYGALLARHRGSFDVLQIEHPAFGDLIDGLAPPGTPVVYGSQNVEYDYVRAECGAAWVRGLAGRRMRRLEQRLVQRSAAIFACAATDGRRFAELYGVSPDKIKIVPNGVDLPNTQYPDSRQRLLERFPRIAGYDQLVLFTGSDVAHNRAGVDYTLRQLAPRLPEHGFVIQGRCARRFARHRATNVFLYPEGEDLLPYRGDDTLAINPVTSGSGTSMKALHYLAHGLPVVSTPFGMRGLDDLAPFVATSELEHFAEALQRDHAPPADMRGQLEPYTWRRSAHAARDAYAALLGATT